MPTSGHRAMHTTFRPRFFSQLRTPLVCKAFRLTHCDSVVTGGACQHICHKHFACTLVLVFLQDLFCDVHMGFHILLFADCCVGCFARDLIQRRGHHWFSFDLVHRRKQHWFSFHSFAALSRESLYPQPFRSALCDRERALLFFNLSVKAYNIGNAWHNM